MKKCSNCKNETKEGDIFCEGCGSKVIPFSTDFTAEPKINLKMKETQTSKKNDKTEYQSEKPFYKNIAFIIIFIILAGIALTSIFSNKTQQNSPAPVSTSEPIIKATPPKILIVPEISNTEKNQKLMLQLINPLINKYNYFVKTIDNQLPYWESLNQKYTSTVANLQKLQSVYWRNDVQGVIDQLSYEKELTTKYIDLAKARQGYARGMIGSLNSAYQTYGTAPFDSEFTKTIDDDTKEVDDYILQYDMSNSDGVTQILKARSEKIDTLVKSLFQRLQNSQ